MALKLDLACGTAKHPGFIGIDRYLFDGVDIVRDLMRGLPFSDNTVDHILAQHIVEHFDGEDLLFLVEEMWRVGVPDGVIEVIVPSASSPNRYIDPTHKTRDWSDDSFKFWYVDEKKQHLIHRGPMYGSAAMLELMLTTVNSNRDRYYNLKVIK